MKRGGASPDEPETASPRRGRRSRAAGRSAGGPSHPATQAFDGGKFAPLSPTQLRQIDGVARELLHITGFSEAPDFVTETVTAHGGAVTPEGRLVFPATLVDRALAGLNRNIVLHGQRPGFELELTGNRVHMGSGGAAPNVIDLKTGTYRPSTLRDLHDAARVVDALDHVAFFSRSLVAGDMPDDRTLDINTAFASLAGTGKHVMTSVSRPEHVAAIAEMCFEIAGSPEAFRDGPFLSLNVNHVVPPLRFAGEACGVLVEAARLGLPVQVNTFGQLAASSPVTIAGCLAQTVAETLAGMILAWLVNPDVKAVFGPRPMVTDLRTGAMAGGCGEQALLTAAAVQMAQFYGLPNSTIAGATDAKTADAQSGYEKSLAVSLAAQAGCNMITQACGMQAGLMAAAFESYVIDNEMLGAIARSLAPVDLGSDALSAVTIREVVLGEGHFLGHPETLRRMETDFLYPAIADRRSFEAWAEAGSPDIRETARIRAAEILDSHFPDHLAPQTEARLRARFDIRLPPRQRSPQ